ncbi:2980_t:CDS:2 [Acaulospora colombiana]|uniref:2980_t:CDS:1 n=1 Tax=Acaulospora colombiana TaxID=27376 RepID=A0ACA9K325_9GLOM|nr:2980_t:CDS:2 [Acaulospora colombiana]
MTDAIRTVAIKSKTDSTTAVCSAGSSSPIALTKLGNTRMTDSRVLILGVAKLLRFNTFINSD